LTTFCYTFNWANVPPISVNKKKILKNVVKGPITLEVQSPKNLLKKLAIFIAKNHKLLFFLLSNAIFKR
jgi:hypothetical protein